MKPIDVVALRAACVDIVLKVPRLPGYDEKLMGSLIGWLPGGTMGNFACALSRLGVNVGWSGSLGDDDLGRLVLEDFQRFGVDTKATKILPEQDTHFTVVAVDPTGEKAVIVVHTLKEPPELASFQKDYVTQAKLLYLAPYDLDFASHVSKIAKEHRLLVAMDLEDSSPISSSNIGEILGAIDIAIFNRSGIGALYGEKAIEAALAGEMSGLEHIVEEVLSYGPELVAVTLGKDGCLISDGTDLVVERGFEVDVVDTTGAGDSFNAALVAGYLWDWDIGSIASFANAVGALAVTAYGPRGNLPTFPEVVDFLAERGIALPV